MFKKPKKIVVKSFTKETLESDGKYENLAININNLGRLGYSEYEIFSKNKHSNLDHKKEKDNYDNKNDVYNSERYLGYDKDSDNILLSDSDDELVNSHKTIKKVISFETLGNNGNLIQKSSNYRQSPSPQKTYPIKTSQNLRNLKNSKNTNNDNVGNYKQIPKWDLKSIKEFRMQINDKVSQKHSKVYSQANLLKSCIINRQIATTDTKIMGVSHKRLPSYYKALQDDFSTVSASASASRQVQLTSENTYSISNSNTQNNYNESISDNFCYGDNDQGNTKANSKNSNSNSSCRNSTSRPIFNYNYNDSVVSVVNFKTPKDNNYDAKIENEQDDEFLKMKTTPRQTFHTFNTNTFKSNTKNVDLELESKPKKRQFSRSVREILPNTVKVKGKDTGFSRLSGLNLKITKNQDANLYHANRTNGSSASFASLGKQSVFCTYQNSKTNVLDRNPFIVNNVLKAIKNSKSAEYLG